MWVSDFNQGITVSFYFFERTLIRYGFFIVKDAFIKKKPFVGESF